MCSCLHTQHSLLRVCVHRPASHAPFKWVILCQCCLFSDTAIPLNSASSTLPLPQFLSVGEESTDLLPPFPTRQGWGQGWWGDEQAQWNENTGKKEKAGVYEDLPTLQLMRCSHGTPEVPMGRRVHSALTDWPHAPGDL